MELPKEIKDEIWNFCRTNNIPSVDNFIIKMVKQGFTSEKYGSTPWDKPAEIVEKIIEKVVEKEVIKEVPVEVIKEVVVEKETTDNSLKPKLDALQNTVQKLKQDNIDKDKKIREYEKTIEDIQKFNDDKRAMFLKGSNLDDKLYK